MDSSTPNTKSPQALAAVLAMGLDDRGLGQIEHPSNTSFPQIPGFKIVRSLGEGGMGTVYEAEQERPCRRVALKLISPHLISPHMLRRFEFETDLLGRLEHRGIARIYHAGMASTPLGRQPFFVMELITGLPLDQWVKAHNPSLKWRLQLLIAICDAVHHAHTKGIIHRDLKPSNILVTDDGQPKILDFGIARATDADLQSTTLVTSPGDVVGTLPYMAPEQAAGKADDLDTSSDVYALGVIAYELLSGKMPYDLKDKAMHEQVKLICESEPTRLGNLDRTLRGDVETIVGKALEKDRTRRYHTAGELAADVKRYLDYEPITARRPSTWYQLRKFAGRNRLLVASTATIMLLLAGGTITSTLFAVRAHRAATTAALLRHAAEVAQHQAVQQRNLAEQQQIAADAARGEEMKQREVAEAAARRSGAVSDFLKGILLSPSDPAGAGTNETVGAALQRAADSVDRLFGSDPDLCATIHDTLGRTYQQLNVLPAAERQFEAAITQFEAKSGPADPEAVEAKLHLAEFYADTGRLAEAEELLRQYVKQLQGNVGPSNVETFEVELCLANVLVARGKIREASPILQRTLEARITVAVDQLAAIGSGKFRPLKSLQADPQALTQGLRLYRQRWSELASQRGETDRYTLACAYLLADCNLLINDPVSAEQVFQWLLPRSKAALGLDHPFTLQVMRGLAESLDGQCEPDKTAAAASLLLEYADERMRSQGPESPSALRARALELERLERLGDYQHSMPLRTELLAKQQKVYGSFHPQTMQSLDSLAQALIASNKAEDARNLYIAASDAAAREIGAEATIAKQLRERIAAIDAGTGEADANATLKLTVLDIRGKAEYRLPPDEVWKKLTLGLVLAEGAELRTGLRSAVQLSLSPGQVITIDRLGVVKLDRAWIIAGKVTKTFSMPYGRVRYEIEADGSEYEATFRSPNATLSIKG